MYILPLRVPEAIPSYLAAKLQSVPYLNSPMTRFIVFHIRARLSLAVVLSQNWINYYFICFVYSIVHE